MNTDEIKDKVLSGSKWSIIEKFSLQLVQFIVGIILARILGPKAFGLIAITSIFITISGAIMDGGFEKALIQNQKLTSLQTSTVFYINTLLGILMTLLISVAAPNISAFFNSPELVRILQVLSIGLIINALGQTQRTLLMKELNFKKIAIANIVSVGIGGVVGIVLAINDFGVWSLVYSSLISTLASTLIFWFKSTWYPQFIFSYSSISRMIPFGLNVLASGILFFFLQQFNSFIIGKYYTKTELGLFVRGTKFPEMVTSVIQGVVLKISFPLFSKLQDDNLLLKNLLRKSNRIIAFITFPLLAFIFFNATEIVVTLLNHEWIGAVIFLKIFCIANMFDPFISIHRELLLAKGKASLLFRLFILTSLIEIIPILIFIKYGILYVAYIALISKLIQYLIYTIISTGKMNVTLTETLEWILPYLVIVILICSGILLFNFILPSFILNNYPLKLTINLLLGGTLYFIIGFRYKLEEFNTFKQMLFSFLNRK